LRKVQLETMSAPQSRRQDIMVVAGLGAMVILVLGLAGALGLLEVVAGSAAVFALALFYSLLVGPATNSEEPEGGAVATPNRPVSGELDLLIRENLPVPVLLIGPGGRIEQANPAARSFLGLGTHTDRLSGVLRQPQVLEAVSAALRGEFSEPIEYAATASIDSHARAFVTPLSVAETSHAGWRAMLVLFDETAVKRAERMRADFLANASHELRTPLASVAGFIETLRGHAKDDPDARERFLSIMAEQTERMRRLINDLLSLSRVEMNEHLAPSDVADLSALSRDVLDFLGPQLAAKSITVETDLVGGATVIGDRDQLTEVTQNLIENAIKYSPASSTIRIEVEVGVSRDDAERQRRRLGDTATRLGLSSPAHVSGQTYVVFRVSDQGVGIARRYLPRLTERFYRVDGQKSGAREGTGLGLAIVKHIVNRHRGGFAVESAEAIGSIFTIYLPQSDGAPETARDEV
jgi:two-component system phosphate regulon sensor histidine kinase PhoR